MTKDTDKVAKYFFIVIALIVIVVLFDEQTTDRNFTRIPPLTLPVEQLWSIEEAERNLEKSYHVGSGTVIDEALLVQLLRQSWQGDKNALLQNITLLEDAEYLTEMTGTKSDYYRFLDKNKQYLVDANGKQLKEPIILKKDRSALITKLADMGHPAASRIEAAGLLRSSFIHGLTAEEEIALRRYLQNTIDGGYRWKDRIANLILFPKVESVDNSGSRPRLKSLMERKQNINPDDIKTAINDYYLPYAMHSDPVSMVRIAEAYQLGLGVEQNDILANAWARVSDYYLYLLIEKNKETYQEPRKNLFLSMQKIVQDIVQQTESALSAGELIKAQKEADKLMEQIEFDENWKGRRDPVPPMP